MALSRTPSPHENTLIRGFCKHRNKSPYIVGIHTFRDRIQTRNPGADSVLDVLCNHRCDAHDDTSKEVLHGHYPDIRFARVSRILYFSHSDIPANGHLARFPVFSRWDGHESSRRDARHRFTYHKRSCHQTYALTEYSWVSVSHSQIWCQSRLTSATRKFFNRARDR